MTKHAGKLAVITGASSGIGLELARIAAADGFDLIIAADEPEIERAAATLGGAVSVQPVQADLSTIDGVDALYEMIRSDGRPVELLIANAGTGMGHAFLDQDFARVRHIIDTNVTGTLYLLHKVGSDMRAANHGHILITGSIAGFTPGAFNAVYNGTKAFINSFAFAIRNELQDTEVTVTCLMPGATDTDFFRRADMLDTPVGEAKKDDPAMVARTGYDAVMRGDGDIVSGWKNKLVSALANVTPSGMLAQQHRKMAQPDGE